MSPSLDCPVCGESIGIPVRWDGGTEETARVVLDGEPFAEHLRSHATEEAP